MKRKTNMEMIRDLMKRSKYGALMQAFIIEAISVYAYQILRNDLEEYAKMFGGNSFINPYAWYGCAGETVTMLEKFYGAPKRTRDENVPGTPV